MAVDAREAAALNAAAAAVIHIVGEVHAAEVVVAANAGAHRALRNLDARTAVRRVAGSARTADRPGRRIGARLMRSTHARRSAVRLILTIANVDRAGVPRLIGLRKNEGR